MLRISTKPRHKNATRPAVKSAPAFLQWLRGRDCVMAFNCEGGIEAAHVDYAGDKGMATKVADCHAIPMCSKHHAEQHRVGWRSFEAQHGNFDALSVAEQYWSAWPGRLAWERKQQDADSYTGEAR